MTSERYVVGIDYGTLSGRAVVVRVSDGAELASAVHDYGHAVLERQLPGGEPLGLDWALQVPSDYVDVLRTAVPKAVAASGVSTRGRHRDSDGLHGLHRAADASRTARPCASFPSSRTDRTRTSSCGSTTPPSRRRSGSTRWPHERGESWLARYGGKLSSEWEFAKGLQLLEEDPDIYARTERWVEAADWIVWQLCGRVRAQRLHRRLQGRSAGRRLSDQGLPAALNPGLRRTSSPTRLAHRARQSRRERRRADRAGSRLDRSPDQGSRWRSATSTRTSRRRPRRRDRSWPDARGHGHVDLPRDERRRPRRGPRHVRRRRRRHHPGLLGLRGRPVRRRRHLRAGSSDTGVPAAYDDEADAAGVDPRAT